MAGVYEALTGRQHIDGSAPFSELVERLVTALGTAKAAARVLGVGDTTLYRWRRGRQTPKTGGTAIARAIRRVELAPGMERDVRTKAVTMRVKGVVRVSRDVRVREINLGLNISQQRTSNFVSNWLADNDARAERLWWKAVDEQVGADITFDEIILVEYR
jgi:DNA-binding transcriptional regulator YdaS (Cro superfamily)